MVKEKHAAKKSLNGNLHKAKSEKNDEFYTQLTDIEKELVHYEEHFKDKIVYCNCDNPQESKFWEFFAANFERLGLKKLISTYYNKDGQSYKTEMTRTDNQ
jgi:GTPase involved in cell partitioning and DNA repair